MDFRTAARKLATGIEDNGLSTHRQTVSPQPTNRPVILQPLPSTDGLDPAAPGGPAPMNSGQGPYGTPVASDPLLETPIQPGAAIPHVKGPDLSTTTLV